MKLSCVNWYGFQLEDLVLNGLDRQPLEVIALRIKELGFNCIRLVYALDVIYKNPVSQNLFLLKTQFFGQFNPIFLCNGIRWPLFYYLHHNLQSLLIIFVHWTQLSGYWAHDTNYVV